MYSDGVLCLFNGLLGAPVGRTVPNSDFFASCCVCRGSSTSYGVFLLNTGRNVTIGTVRHVGRGMNHRVIINTRSPSFNFRGRRSRYRGLIHVIGRDNTGILLININTPGRRG